MSSSYTDITYAKVVDMWKHPETLTIVEYALVKYILNNEVYDDDGATIDDLHKRLEVHEEHIDELENEVESLQQQIEENDVTIDKLREELHWFTGKP